MTTSKKAAAKKDDAPKDEDKAAVQAETDTKDGLEERLQARRLDGQAPDADGEEGTAGDGQKIGGDPKDNTNPDDRTGDGVKIAPASAKLDPPQTARLQAERPRDKMLATDARLDATQVGTVLDEDGNEVTSADGLFEDSGLGYRRATKTLFQTGVTTRSERAVTTLVIARGQEVSAAGAEVILNKIKG